MCKNTRLVQNVSSKARYEVFTIHIIKVSYIHGKLSTFSHWWRQRHTYTTSLVTTPILSNCVLYIHLVLMQWWMVSHPLSRPLVVGTVPYTDKVSQYYRQSWHNLQCIYICGVTWCHITTKGHTLIIDKSYQGSLLTMITNIIIWSFTALQVNERVHKVSLQLIMIILVVELTYKELINIYNMSQGGYGVWRHGDT